MNPYTTDELTPPDTDENGGLQPLVPPPPGTIRFIDIHVYDQPAREEDTAEVESTLEGGEAVPPSGQNQDEQDIRQQTTLTHPQYKKLIPLALVLISLLLIATIMAVPILPLFAPTAIITIIPVSNEISTVTTITVTTGSTSAPSQLTGRILPAISMSQAKTIQTTGMAHQEAQEAHGLIFFYNAAPYAQTVAAGSLLTGTDGTQVVTDQDAVIPAGNLATNGQASVEAHATISGTAGNIQSGDIYGQCCRLDVLASNTAFHGGQQARDYQTVTKQDISNAVASISASLQQSVQTALQTQVQPSEALISPPPCTQLVTSEFAAGSEARGDRITVNETCTGVAYSAQAYQRLITKIITKQAQQELGTGYSLIGESQSIITQVTNKHGTLALHLHLSGTYAYQFSQEQQAQIKSLIAGKSKGQATSEILKVPGVQSVSLTTRNGVMLPTDIAHIQVIFVVMP